MSYLKRIPKRTRFLERLEWHLAPVLEMEQRGESRDKETGKGDRLMKKRLMVLILSLALFALCVSMAHAKPPKPPKQAFEVCADKSEGDACEFPGRNDETVEGECAQLPHFEKLACKPDKMPPPPRGDHGDDDGPQDE